MDWPGCGLQGAIAPIAISTFGPDAGAQNSRSAIGSVASTAWPSANRAIFVPFRVQVPVVAYKMIVGCGATAGGNFDVGLYDHLGNRLVSAGGTARVATTEVVRDIADTPLSPGVYYMALAVSTTNTMSGQNAGNVGIYKMAGIKQMDAAYPLPVTATFATLAASIYPAIVTLCRSW